MTDLVADPGNAMRYYAGVRGGGVYRSDDAGQTWNPVNGAGMTALSVANDAFDNDGNRLINDVRETAAGAERIILAVQQSTGGANAVYAALAGTSPNDWLMGVFRSTDQGGTWQPLGQVAPAPEAALKTARLPNEELQVTANNTITRTAGNFVKDGFIAGQLLTIAGSTVPANNGTYHIQNVIPGAITLVETTRFPSLTPTRTPSSGRPPRIREASVPSSSTASCRARRSTSAAQGPETAPT